MVIHSSDVGQWMIYDKDHCFVKLLAIREPAIGADRAGMCPSCQKTIFEPCRLKTLCTLLLFVPPW